MAEPQARTQINSSQPSSVIFAGPGIVATITAATPPATASPALPTPAPAIGLGLDTINLVITGSVSITTDDPRITIYYR